MAGRRRGTLWEEGFIYFVRTLEGSPMVKIGFSIDPLSRINAIQMNSPVELELIGRLQGTRRVEGEIHRYFKKERCHGEWFIASDRLLEFIKSKTKSR